VIDHQYHNDQGILRGEIDLALSADKKLRFGIRLVHYKFASSECLGVELCRMSPNEFPDTATEYDIDPKPVLVGVDNVMLILERRRWIRLIC
jgi:hypothetical protein